MSPLSHRVLPALLGVALVAGVAGCGSSGAETATDTKPLDPPVKVEHKYGSTTVDAIPERVVTIDLQWTDVMLAMGVEPVGYTVDSLMPDSGVPWQDLPKSAKPLSLEDGVPVEQIAALQPDLIVGSFSITDRETYKLLSDVAPTIAGIEPKQVTPWPDLVRIAGKVLDDRKKANRVIDSVTGKIEATAADLPGLKGKTFALAQYIVGDSITIVADEEDGASRLFRQLGMELYPPVVRAGKNGSGARVTVSTERADLLRADLLGFLINGGDRRDLADIPGFDDLPGTVAILDYPTVVGINTPSPKSIPHVLTELRPYLEDAAGAKS